MLTGIVDGSIESRTYLLNVGYIDVLGHRVSVSEVRVHLQIGDSESSNYEANSDSQLLVLLNCTVDETAESEGLAREVTNRIQKLRKEVSNQYLLYLLMFYSSSPILIDIRVSYVGQSTAE